MSISRHGISIGMEQSGSDFYMTFSVIGKLTHADYEVITPIIDSAMEGVTSPRIKALIDIRELEGWEARAAWDDFKLGLKHGREFDRVAVVGSQRWAGAAAKVGSWFMSGEVKSFAEVDEALAWLNS